MPDGLDIDYLIGGEERDRSPDGVIAALAAKQHRAVARRQLVASGLTARQVHRRVERGLLRAFHRGVYAVGAPALSANGRRMAAILSAGGRAALSHRGAGRTGISSSTPVRSRSRLHLGCAHVRGSSPTARPSPPTRSPNSTASPQRPSREPSSTSPPSSTTTASNEPGTRPRSSASTTRSRCMPSLPAIPAVGGSPSYAARSPPDKRELASPAASSKPDSSPSARRGDSSHRRPTP